MAIAFAGNLGGEALQAFDLALHRTGDFEPAEAVGLGDLGGVLAPQHVIAGPDAANDAVARYLVAGTVEAFLQRTEMHCDSVP